MQTYWDSLLGFGVAVFTRGIGLAQISLLLAFGIIVYRHLRLPSLPWLLSSIVLNYIGSGIASWLNPHIMGNITNTRIWPHSGDHLSPAMMNEMHKVLIYEHCAPLLIIIGTLFSFLVFLVTLSEMAHFLTLCRPEIQSKLLARLQQLRAYSRTTGVALVTLSVCGPALGVILTLWFTILAKEGAW